MKFKRGMTVHERVKVRAYVLRSEVERAYERAANSHRSLTCQTGMRATGSADPGLAREFHARCRGEEPGNSGCLCECHDDHRGGVVSGTGSEMSQDQQGLLTASSSGGWLVPTPQGLRGDRSGKAP